MTRPNPLLVGALMITIALALPGFRFDGSMRGDHGVIAQHPDPRVVWQPYPVGGMLLTNPAVLDSTGCPVQITIPEGSVLVVPYVVFDDETKGLD